MGLLSLTALGRTPLPCEIEVRGRRYTQRRVFKNDFFAVTAQYQDGESSVILKVHRQASFLFVPISWIGRLLARRESACLRRLAGVDGVPRFIGRWGPTGVIREYIDGHPLARGERVADDFHRRLLTLIDTVHQHRMAYVDLEKCENVLVGKDGRPYLFDFQISWYWPPRWGGELPPMRWIRRWLQQGDLYHLVKLQRRTRPDQLSPEAIADSYRKPWHVYVQRFLTYPFTWCRRRVLNWIAPRTAPGERGRIIQDEWSRAA